MNVQYNKDFFRQYKKADVRIRNSVDKRISIFRKNPKDTQLNNNSLKREWKGFRSIDITSGWRAVYEELHEGEEIIAYFVALGTHDQLYW